MSAPRKKRMSPRERGGLKALVMLRDIQDTSLEKLTIDPQWRSAGSRQVNVVAKYLRNLSGEELHGFSLMLNEFLAMNAHSGAPDLERLAILSPHMDAKSYKKAEHTWGQINAVRAAAGAGPDGAGQGVRP